MAEDVGEIDGYRGDALQQVGAERLWETRLPQALAMVEVIRRSGRFAVLLRPV